MTFTRMLWAGAVALAVAAPLVTPASAQSVLQVLRGATSNRIQVDVNRAIVMESDRPFAELSVANPAIADIATLGERTLYVLGRAPGRTTLTILDEDGQLITNVDVQVSPDVAEFKERLREILPREAIDVRTASDGIVLSGRVSSSRRLSRALELAERYAPGRVTNLMVVGGSQQVMLKVRFAEMTRSVAKELRSSIGISGLGDGDEFVGAIGGGGFTDLDGNALVTGGAGLLPGGNGFTIDSGAGGALAASVDISGAVLNLVINALENKGMVRTLAEPNLTAVSGRTADFLAGGEFPVIVQGGEGESDTVEFKEFGVLLEFTPVVIDEDIIQLTLNMEVSAIDTAVQIQGFPGLTTRRAVTVVEMRDGQSMAIAGLLQDDFTDSVAQTPWLGDVPILGALFRSTDFSRRQSELVIIVTPHIVAPTSSDAIALPTDRMRIPNERELFLNGRVSSSPIVSDVARQDFQGTYGYVME